MSPSWKNPGADSRGRIYVAMYGRESWELDALDPAVLDALVEDAIRDHMDEGMYEEVVGREEEAREAIRRAARSMEEDRREK